MIVYFRYVIDLQGVWIGRDYKAGIGQIIGIGNGQGYRQNKCRGRIVDLLRNFSMVKVITFTWIIWRGYNSRDWYGGMDGLRDIVKIDKSEYCREQWGWMGIGDGQIGGIL